MCASLAALDAFAEFDPDSLAEVLHEAGRFVGDVIAPTNRDGDKVGSRRNDDGTVTTPPGFKQAYRQWVDGGWAAAPFDPDLRRRWIAVGGRDRRERDGHRGEHGVFVVPDVDAGRDPHARCARQRRAEGHLPRRS